MNLNSLIEEEQKLLDELLTNPFKQIALIPGDEKRELVTLFASLALKVAQASIEAVIPEKIDITKDTELMDDSDFIYAGGYNQCRNEVIKKGREYVGE